MLSFEDDVPTPALGLQMVRPTAQPAPAPAPQLPRAVKGTLADRVDRRMAVFAAASLLVHVGVMTAAHVNDPPAHATMAERALAQYTPETIAIIDADDPMLDLDQPPPLAPDPQAPPGAATTPRPAPATSDPARPARPRPAPPTAGAPELSGDARRMADLLFASDGGGKVDGGELAPRRPGADLEKQLAEVNAANARVSIGGEHGDRLRDRGPRPGTVDQPVIGDPRIARVDGDKGEKVPPTRIDVRPQPPRQPGVDIDAIIGKIRTTYMSTLQRCYKKALGGEPTLSGKVSLQFTLSEKGTVGDPEARGVADELETCIEGVMPRWTFTPVTDEDGDPVELDIGVTLQLSI